MSWESVLVKWVNSLDLLRQIESIAQLSDGEFFVKLVEKLEIKGCGGKKPNSFLLTSYLKGIFPEFVAERTLLIPVTKSVNPDSQTTEIDKKELTYITSALLIATTLHTSDDFYRNSLLKFEESLQIQVKRFLEETCGKKIVRSTLSNAIQKSSSVLLLENCDTPLSSKDTKKKRNSTPLKGFFCEFESPIIKRHLAAEKENQTVKSLEEDLEKEWNENCHLKTSLEEASKTIAALTSKLKEKDSKIKDLESILSKEDEIESDEGHASFQGDKQYLDEISVRENIIKNLQSELDECQEKIFFFEEQASDLDKQTTIMKQTIVDYDIFKEKLKEENIQYKNQYDALQEKYFEQEKILDEMKSMKDTTNVNDSSFSFQAGVDLGQEVTDLLLKEKDDKLLELESENKRMADRINELTVQLNENNVCTSQLQLNISGCLEEINLKNEQLSCLKLKEEMLNKLSSEFEELRKQANLAEILKMELENIKENFMNEKKVSENLRKEVHELKNLQASNKIIISEINEKNASLVKRIELATSEITALVVKNEELEKILSDKSKEIIGLNSSIMSKDKLIEEINGVRSEYKTFQNEHKNCDEVSATVKFLKQDCIKVEQHLQFIRNEYEILKNDQLRLHTEVVEATDELKVDFRNQLALLKQEMESLLEEKDLLLKNLSDECESLSSKLELTEIQKAEFETLQKNYEEEKRKTDCLQKELSDLITSHSICNFTICELNEKNSLLVKKQEELKSEVTGYNKKIDDLKKIVSDKRVEIYDLYSKLRSRDKTIKEMNEIKKAYIALQNEHEKCVESKAEEGTIKEAYFKLLEDCDLLRNENEALKRNQQSLQAAHDEATNKWDALEKKQVEFEKLRNENETLKHNQDELQAVHDEVRNKWNLLQKKQIDIEKKIRADFENQLMQIKQQMKACWNDEMEKKNDEFKEKLRQYKEKISKDEAHIAELSSQLWETSDKLLLAQNEYLKLKSKLQNLALFNVRSSPDFHVDNRRRSLSVGSIPLPYQHTGPTIIEHSEVQPVPGSTSGSHLTEGTDDTTQMRRRGFLLAGMGKKFTLPSGKVFPSEDETGEVFDNRNLVDLKEGRCNLPDGSERLSTLMLRNSLCPPHLKSSYPAETQFLLPMGPKEEDIKAGLICEETNCNGNKKGRNQACTSRSFHTQGNVLRELNINDKSQKQSTPGRLRSLFSATRTSKRDENTPNNNSTSSKDNSLTPRRRRLSFFHKHFGNRDGNDNGC
ncbi:uncharacterized protein LOC142321483 isoform X2 [Lycorma delicatula]|uniref:uncharacterized protein LOC142321483 isoform X2 n=1 Tax=Lycorma delicatula TaxID=130591 RepID=UPI003F512CA2